MLKQAQPNEAVSRKLLDISKRLEEGLFKSATTKVFLSYLCFVSGISYVSWL